MPTCWTRLAATAAIIAVTGCAAERDTATVAGCAPDAKPANLNFTVKDLDGKDVALNAYKGQVILLDFWATWCGPCKFEIPGFIELYTTYRSQGLQVLGFAVDDPVPALRDYAKQMSMNYPILVGLGREDVVDAFGPMPGLPTTFIIGRDGKVCTSHTGFTEKEEFEQQITALL
jgi:thiol-disulfide isomerase/thioredoxin